MRDGYPESWPELWHEATDVMRWRLVWLLGTMALIAAAGAWLAFG